MSAEANIESAKKAYAAFTAGNGLAAMANLSDDIEWIVSGESALSGTYRGNAQVGELWATIAEKSHMTSPQRFLADDDIVVVLSTSTCKASRPSRSTCSPTATAKSSSSGP